MLKGDDSVIPSQWHTGVGIRFPKGITDCHVALLLAMTLL